MSVEFGRTAITKIIKGPGNMRPAVNIGIPIFRPLENTMSLPNRFDPAGEIRFNSPSILQQAEKVASAAWGITQVPDVFQSALEDVNLDPSVKPSVPKFDILREASQVASAAWERTEPVVAELNVAEAISEAESILAQAARAQIGGVEVPQALDPTVKPTEVEPKTESRVATQVSQTTLTLPKEAVQTAVEKQVITPNNKTEPVRLKEFAQIEQDRLVDVEDWQVADQRRFEIRVAIKKTWAATKKVVGWMVAKFLPGQHEGNTSQIVRKIGSDGSLVDTQVAIMVDPREYQSEQEAQQGLLPYVAKYKPVKRAKTGEPAGREDVERIFKYHHVKPKTIYELVVARVTRKKIYYNQNSNHPVREETEVKAETSLEDYPQLQASLIVDRLK